MATGTRLRPGTVYGTLSDAALTNNAGSVTMNSVGLGTSFCPGVVAPSYMPVILDPQQQFGTPEIVWVTAHTASATTATVTRAQEGTALRAHSSGEFWVAGQTTQDFFPWNWTSYTPTWATPNSQPSIGNGTLTGSYILFGTTCLLSIFVLFGSTTSGGTGAWTFSLPAGISTPANVSQNLVCEAQTTGSGNFIWSGFGNLPGTTTVVYPFLSSSDSTTHLGQVQNTNSGGATGNGIPNTGNNYPFGNGANLAITGVFQTA